MRHVAVRTLVRSTSRQSSLGLALGLHGGVVLLLALLSSVRPPALHEATPELVLLQWQPVPTAVAEAEPEPPEPQLTESALPEPAAVEAALPQSAATEPVPPVEIPPEVATATPVEPAPAAVAAFTPPPPQRPTLVKPRPRAVPSASLASPPAAAVPMAVPVPNAVPAAAAPAYSSVVPSWHSALVGRLARYKRYPEAARFHRVEGVVQLTFSMDREGHVLLANIAQSSGSAELDAEVLALVRRAEPLPAPPPELPGNPLTLTLPVRFSLQAPRP